MLKKPDYKPWVDLVIAMLSTGGYRMERTYRCREQLIKNGLTNPQEISLMDINEVAVKLIESGYDRGPLLTKMFADRLYSLGEHSNSLEKNENILIEGTKNEVTSLLIGIKGVGPVVIEYFLILREGNMK